MFKIIIISLLPIKKQRIFYLIFIYTYIYIHIHIYIFSFLHIFIPPNPHPPADNDFTKTPRMANTSPDAVADATQQRMERTDAGLLDMLPPCCKAPNAKLARVRALMPSHSVNMYGLWRIKVLPMAQTGM